MNIEEARLYLEHTSKDDFNLEEHQKENRYQAIQVVLKEIERLNNIINEIEKDIKNLYTYGIKNNAEQKDYLLNRLEGLKEYRGSDKE